MSGNEIVSNFNYDLKREAAPAAGAGTASGLTELEGTHWTLLRLGDAEVSPNAEPNEIFFILDSKEHRVSGSGGCNRLMGGYELHADKLKFAHMGSSMMACAQGMDTERAFLQAMEQVSSWKIAGQTLELFDTGGKSLARFDAQAGQ
jgi:heat shock protein HslJ